MSTTELCPADVVDMPGTAEAAAIRADYDVAKQGMRAFVSMGLRLMDVKARLPHGHYMPWVAKHLPDLTHRQLHKAKCVAWSLCEAANVKLEPRFQFEDLPPEVLAIIEGASSQRALLSTVHEFREGAEETLAAGKCEEYFRKDPDLRDEWEPRVLSGEMSWCQAVRGIAGAVATSGVRRGAADYAVLVRKSLVTLRNGFARWGELPDAARAEAAIEFRQIVAELPQELRALLGLPKS